MTTDEFIKKAKSVHGDKYTYDKSVYGGAHKKLTITCPVHGDFVQPPHSHVYHKFGCRKCAYDANGKKCRSTTDEFVLKSRKVHGDLYDYSLVEYTQNWKKVTIICTIHGQFEQSPYDHYSGANCPKCEGFLSHEERIEKFKEVHGDLYDYSLVKYVNRGSRVKIICKEHGLFHQRPDDHQDGHGCPQCGRSNNALELKLLRFIKSNTSEVIHNGRPKWLGRMSFDIYLPSLNVAIEYQGRQHFEPIPYFGGIPQFKIQLERDLRKRKLATENNCRLLYFSYKTDYIPPNYEFKVYSDEKELIERVKEFQTSS